MAFTNSGVARTPLHSRHMGLRCRLLLLAFVLEAVYYRRTVGAKLPFVVFP